jgi:acetyltransferase-like isoleucine patch superfamily enzyme
MRLVKKKTAFVNFHLVKFNNRLWTMLTKNVPFLQIFYRTKDTEAFVDFRLWWFQKVLGFNRGAYWPVHFRSTINDYRNILVGKGSAPGLAPGCYIQGRGKLYIGDYVGIGPNVGIMAGTHHLHDLRIPKNGITKIGSYSWIGMNSVVLANVELGDFTIVQAGSMVKDSFPKGYCVIGGNPAKLIKQFPPESHHLFERYTSQWEYNGYIPAHKFENWRKKNLWI